MFRLDGLGKLPTFAGGDEGVQAFVGEGLAVDAEVGGGQWGSQQGPVERKHYLFERSVGGSGNERVGGYIGRSR
jgi:hypothetical protein